MSLRIALVLLMVFAIAPSSPPSALGAALVPPAAKCQAAIGKEGQKLKKSILKAWTKCLDGTLTGSGCDAGARDGAIGLARSKFTAAIVKRCSPTLLFSAPPSGIGFPTSCLVDPGPYSPAEQACTALPVNDPNTLGGCLSCWKEAELHGFLTLLYPCLSGQIPAGSALDCGTAPGSCPGDSAGITCARIIAKAGTKYFAKRDKALEKCLDNIRSGKFAGPCPDAKTQAKLAAAESKVVAQVVKKCPQGFAWWDVCPASCGLPIASPFDIGACVGAGAADRADEVICQQYPGAAADGISCPTVVPTTTTTSTSTSTSNTTLPPPTTSTSTSTTTTSSSSSSTTTGPVTTTTSSSSTTSTTLLSRTCTFRSGTQAFIQGKTLSASVAITGHQEWRFGPTGPNGVRNITIPASGTHFDPAALPLGVGTLCVRANGDGTGTIDCDGGQPAYNNTAQQDHNTTNPPGGNGGFAQDPTCDDTFTQPNGSIATANLEVSGDPHPGVCNSPVHVVESGNAPAGGMKLFESLILRLITSGSCPADNAPFDGGAGDILVSGSISSGTSAGTIFDVNNTSGNLQQSGSGCGLFGTSACTTNVVGTPFSCANVDANNLSTGKLGLAFPALDIPTVNDVVATLTVLCQ